jgi:hypothetical protein
MNDSVYEGALVPSISIDNLVNQRQAVVDKILQALRALAEARDLADAAHLGFPRFELNNNRYAISTILDPDRIDETRKTVSQEVDRHAWQYLMNESGLRTLMDAKARGEWNESINNGKFPELTAANVAATFEQLFASRADMFDRGVIACFKQLSWDYKTNKPFKFGKRVVLRYIRGTVSPGARGSVGTSLGWVSMNSNTNALDDLSRVLSVLDGKPEADHRQGWYSRLNRVNKTTDPDAEDDYLSVRCFRNGNGHVTFKRPDLVDKMNQILAKHYPGALAFDKHGE